MIINFNLFSFFKKKEPVITVPQWSRLANASDYMVFKRAVQHYFKDEDVQLNFNEGLVVLDEINTFGVNVISLINLFKHCLSRGNSDTFLLTIEEFLGNMRKAANADDSSQPFERVKDTLGLRILTSTLFKQMDDTAYIGAPLFENLFHFLVFDLPETVKNVSRADVAHWGKSDSELLEIGKNNIALKYPQTITQQEIVGLKIWTVENDYFYAPNLMLDIEKYPGLVGPYGSLAAVPSGDRAFIYPIENIQVTSAVGKMATIANFFYLDKPNPVTPNLYWYYKGRYQHIPYNIEKPDFTLLPESFVEMIRGLTDKSIMTR